MASCGDGAAARECVLHSDYIILLWLPYGNFPRYSLGLAL